MGNDPMKNTTGSGQSVNLVVGEGLGRWLFGAVLILVLLVFFATKTATDAGNKADSATLTSIDQEYNTRQIMLWMMATKAAVEAAGIKAPPIPDLKVGPGAPATRKN